jgi:hypothetical protein
MQIPLFPDYAGAPARTNREGAIVHGSATFRPLCSAVLSRFGPSAQAYRDPNVQDSVHLRLIYTEYTVAY